MQKDQKELFEVTIPNYSLNQGIVYYEIHLRNKKTEASAVLHKRYKELHGIHSSLEEVDDTTRPPFPKTHMFKSTNSNPEMIERRRAKLEYYLQQLVNNPLLRIYPEVESMLAECKLHGDRLARRTTRVNLGHIIV